MLTLALNPGVVSPGHQARLIPSLHVRIWDILFWILENTFQTAQPKNLLQIVHHRKSSQVSQMILLWDDLFNWTASCCLYNQHSFLCKLAFEKGRNCTEARLTPDGMLIGTTYLWAVYQTLSSLFLATWDSHSTTRHDHPHSTTRQLYSL